MPPGRPCEYKDEYLQTALDYLEDFTKNGDEFPMLCGLADIIECDEDKVGKVCEIFREEVERPIFVNNETLVIPLEIATGKNWKDTKKI